MKTTKKKKKMCACGFPQSSPVPHEHDRDVCKFCSGSGKNPDDPDKKCPDCNGWGFE